MDRLKLDPRVIQSLENILNVKSNYSAVSVQFKNGEQSLDTIWVTGGIWNSGEHLLNSWSQDERGDLDAVLSLTQSIESVGCTQACLKKLKNKHAETCKRLNALKGEVKDLQQSIGRLQEHADSNKETK